jgi:hypothetical protein
MLPPVPKDFLTSLPPQSFDYPSNYSPEHMSIEPTGPSNLIVNPSISFDIPQFTTSMATSSTNPNNFSRTKTRLSLDRTETITASSKQSTEKTGVASYVKDIFKTKGKKSSSQNTKVEFERTETIRADSNRDSL